MVEYTIPGDTRFCLNCGVVFITPIVKAKGTCPACKFIINDL